MSTNTPHLPAAAFAAVLFLLLVPGLGAGLHAQEVLKPSRVEAYGRGRGLPELGLPRPAGDGEVDHAVWHSGDVWRGADSLGAAPRWCMSKGATAAGGWPEALGPVAELCAQWASEKPRRSVDVVWGPWRIGGQDGYWVALCKRTKSSLGHKSIAFVIPAGGADPLRNVYAYSRSVNSLEHWIRYDLFPKLPRDVQEIIEEMTAAEHLCSFQEFDRMMEEEGPERGEGEGAEWENDLREP